MFVRLIRRSRRVARVLLAALVSRSNREFYDRIAPIYDEVFTSHLINADQMVEMVLESHRRHPRSLTVLDLGCGTGAVTRRLIARGLAVVSIDVSLDSLRFLKARESGACVVQADLNALPLAEGCAQTAVCLGVWRHLEQPERTIDEICRVLDGNGRLIVGYFPPKLGGLIDVSRASSGEFLIRMYHAIVSMLGYIDIVDPAIEQRARQLFSEKFENVKPVPSGDRTRLIDSSLPKKNTRSQ